MNDKTAYSNVIETRHLSRDYGAIRALDRVNLEIPKERIVALLGPNGAGKTTLLHLLMGMLEPTMGSSSVLGIDSRALGNGMLHRIGYMGDSEAPPPWPTIRQLITLQSAATENFDHAFIKQLLVQKCLLRKTPFGELSKGQQKWLRAGLLLASQPELLLFDEPAEGFDPAARHDFYDYLRTYCTKTGAAALVATHITGDIERVADDVAIIRKGRVVLYESLETLREEVREIFVPAGGLPPELTHRIDVIGEKKHADGTIFWVRCRAIEDNELKELLGSRPVVNHSNLETVYRAATECGRTLQLKTHGETE